MHKGTQIYHVFIRMKIFFLYRKHVLKNKYIHNYIEQKYYFDFFEIFG